MSATAVPVPVGRNVEDLLAERGIDIRHETVRFRIVPVPVEIGAAGAIG
jgi:hypothetical protein